MDKDLSKYDVLISVIIPVKNGEFWIKKSLNSIFDQTLIKETEVIIIDSGSTDNTINILKKYPINLLKIDPKDFNHGETRNIGVRSAKGKYIVMTVQDAIPDSKYWLEHLISGFDDNSVAGVCGQQIVPHDIDKNPIDWFRPLSPPSKKKYYFSKSDFFDSLPPDAKKSICSWDNVNSMYLKKILLQIPFQKVLFAEDALWAKDVLRNGYSIVYNNIARVNHYHFETPEYTFQRSFTLYYHLYKFFGFVPIQNTNELIQILKNCRTLIREKKVPWSNKWKWLKYNYSRRKAVNKAIRIFWNSIEKGEQVLEKKHVELCSNAPQALKPTNKS